MPNSRDNQPLCVEAGGYRMMDLIKLLDVVALLDSERRLKAAPG